MNCCCRTSLTCLLAALLAARCECSLGQQVEAIPAIQLVVHEELPDDDPEPRLAGLIPSSELTEEFSAEKLTTPAESREAQSLPSQQQYWAFPSEHDPSEHETGILLRLPPVDVTPSAEASTGNPLTAADVVELFEPIASLLPPQPLEALEYGKTEIYFGPAVAAPEPVIPEVAAPLTADQKLLQAVIQDCNAATTGVLTDQRVNELAKSKIQNAYAMANRGGYYAARQELIEVLRMISRAKDARQGIPERTEALACGLRALEEADDFAPRGAQLEADLAIDVICASHRTPIAKQIEFKEVLPHQMMNGYFRYAQLKLAAAVAGEPAGSMALHALGKLATELGRVEPERHRLSQRHAIAFQQAALLAHCHNHLAAHELATLLADAGHFAEAEKLLEQVAARDPNAVVLRNLSLMQEKLGHTQQAIANQTLANQLALSGASGTNNVEWVSPGAFSRSGGNAPLPTTAANPPVSRPDMPVRNMPPVQPLWR